MADDRGAAQAREVMDRVFFNTLLIMKGVVLAYGATILVDLIRRGAPWGSGEELAAYLAWAATMLLVALTLVSQAFGSHQTPLHPTTVIILTTFALAIEEFIAFGLLEPQSEAINVEGWFLVVAAQAGTAILFVSVVLHHSGSERYPHTNLEEDLEALVRRDRKGAIALTVLAILSWGLLAYSVLDDTFSWVPVSVVVAIAFYALVQQQKKVNSYWRPDGEEPQPPSDAC